jgi:manganese efflux pump family protein
VKLVIKTAAVAGGILAALLAVGCGARAGGGAAAPGGAGPATVQGCAAYGVYAIQHRITVTSVPPPCQGLSRAEINQAAASAILQVAGGGPKPVWKRRAARAAPFLSYLITGPTPAGSPLPVSAPGQTSSTPASGPLGGKNLALDIAALAAWLVTAASGAYVLGSWVSGGGTLRQRADATGSPPAVIFGHFGLALTGLVIWVAYLIAGWTALAWTAVGVLLPVAGLGMATVSIGLPGRARAIAADGTSPAAEGRLSGGGAGPVVTGTVVTGTVVIEKAETGRVSRRGSLVPLVIVGHGLLAFTTIALVLLAALGTAAS